MTGNRTLSCVDISASATACSKPVRSPSEYQEVLCTTTGDNSSTQSRHYFSHPFYLLSPFLYESMRSTMSLEFERLAKDRKFAVPNCKANGEKNILDDYRQQYRGLVRRPNPGCIIGAFGSQRIVMNSEQFTESLADEAPKSGLSVPLVALWWDAKGNWE